MNSRARAAYYLHASTISLPLAVSLCWEIQVWHTERSTLAPRIILSEEEQRRRAFRMTLLCFSRARAHVRSIVNGTGALRALKFGNTALGYGGIDCLLRRYGARKFIARPLAVSVFLLGYTVPSPARVLVISLVDFGLH